MRCNQFRDRIESYLVDSLAAPDRDAFRQHLRSCPDCREWAITREPTLVFAVTEPAEPDPIQIAACTASVMSQIRQQAIVGRMRPHRRSWLAAAAAVMVVIAGGAGWWISQDEQGAAPTAVVEAEDAGPRDQQPPRVRVEMSAAGVRVYQFAEGSDDNTAVFYIVNPALEL